jgi:hypothetical protein
MSDQKFKVFHGTFLCKSCNEEVKTIRLWIETADVTWMCSKKHVTKVSLVQPKKKKKDFLNE